MGNSLASTLYGKKGAVTCVLSGATGKQRGVLEVSNGSLRWYDGYKTKNNKHVISWEKFIEFANTQV